MTEIFTEEEIEHEMKMIYEENNTGVFPTDDEFLTLRKEALSNLYNN